MRTPHTKTLRCHFTDTRTHRHQAPAQHTHSPGPDQQTSQGVRQYTCLAHTNTHTFSCAHYITTQHGQRCRRCCCTDTQSLQGGHSNIGVGSFCSKKIADSRINFSAQLPSRQRQRQHHNTPWLSLRWHCKMWSKPNTARLPALEAAACGEAHNRGPAAAA